VSSRLPARSFREAKWLIGATLLVLVAMVVTQLAGMLVMTRLVAEEARRTALAAAQVFGARLAAGEAARFATDLRGEGWGVAVLREGRVAESVGEAGPLAPAWWPWASREDWEEHGQPVAGPVSLAGRSVLVAYQLLGDGRVIRAVVPAAGSGTAGWLRTFGASLGVAAVVGGAILAWVLIARALAPYRELLAEAARVSRPPGEDRFLVNTFRDTVRRLEASEAALRQRADELELLANVLTREAAAGVVITDAAGTVRAANLSARALTGTGLGIGEPLPPEVAAAMGTVRLGERVVEVRHLPLLAASGAAQGEVTFLSDTTAVEALQRALAEREQMAAVGELAAGMTHELRNALATIRGYLRLLPEAAPDERSRYVAAVDREAAGLSDLLDRFLRFTQPQQLRRERIDVRVLAADAAARVRAGFPGLALTVSGESATVNGDPLALGVAAENLLRNAAEAVAGSGGGVFVAIERRPGEVRLVVEDEGPGVNETVREKLFVPFVSTKPSGGLGLALARRLARLHGGEVEYEPRAEGGSRFVLRLPAEEDG
jgi:two-component system sensor histidine kinase FlrB